jgi:hypothetical protein
MDKFILGAFISVSVLALFAIAWAASSPGRSLPREVVCAELAQIPHEPGALMEFLRPKYVHEYPPSAVLDCLWVELYTPSGVALEN